jgi:hypothetical protein
MLSPLTLVSIVVIGIIVLQPLKMSSINAVVS